MADSASPIPDPAPPPQLPGVTDTSPARRNRAVLIAAALIAGLVGGIAGAFVIDGFIGDSATTASDSPSMSDATAAGPAIPDASGTTTPEGVETANIALCTEYVAVYKLIPNPIDTPLNVLTGLNGLRWALAENPNASPEIVGAIRAVVENYETLLVSFGDTQPRGLNQPTTYDRAIAQQAVERVVEVCEFGP